ncbi:MAG: hypothetical protein KGL39_25410 [Patescibacteria group bacterium]|nr:hypothetical protein [Patescibacteria group bacterium]
MSTFGEGLSVPVTPEDEGIEPEIMRELTTPKMVIPGETEFSKYVDVKEFDKYTPETRQILLAITTVSNKINYFGGWQRFILYRLRQTEAQHIRSQKKFPQFLTNLGYIAFGAIISAATDYLFRR